MQSWIKLNKTNPATQQRRRAIGLLLLTGLLWSSSGLLIKVIDWSALAILSGRSMVAGLVLLIYLRRTDIRWTRLQISGALGYATTNLLFIMGTKLTAAANAIFLQYTAPLYLVLLGYWLLGERPRRADGVAMAAIFSGMALFFGDDLSLAGFQGNLVSAFSGLAMAVMILSMRGQKTGTPAVTILLGNLLNILIGLPALLQETFSLVNVSIILYLGIFQLGLSFVFYSIAIKQVPALESTLILTTEPILNPVWVFLIIGEAPGPLAMTGAVLVLGAVTARAIISARAVVEELPSPVG